LYAWYENTFWGCVCYAANLKFTKTNTTLTDNGNTCDASARHVLILIQSIHTFLYFEAIIKFRRDEKYRARAMSAFSAVTQTRAEIIPAVYCSNN
jgi:hypothetical protein